MYTTLLPGWLATVLSALITVVLVLVARRRAGLAVSARAGHAAR